MSVGPPSIVCTPSSANSSAQPVAADDRHRAAAQRALARRPRRGAGARRQARRLRLAAAGLGGARLAQARVALGDLQAHVGDVEVRDLAGVGEHGGRALGLVGVQVDLQRASSSPTTSTESPSPSSGAMKRPGCRPLPVTAKLVQKR